MMGLLYSQDSKSYDQLPDKPSRNHNYYSWPSYDQQISIGNTPLTIHYKKLGQGPPLLLVHGLMTSSYSFRFIADELAKYYTVIIPDLPGAGKSDIGTLKPTPDKVADVLKQLLDSVIGINKPVYVVGNSLGGYESVWLAYKYPTSVQKLMIMHSPGFKANKHMALHVFSRVPFAKYLHRSVTKDRKEFTLKSIHYYDPSILSKEEIDEYSQIFATKHATDGFFKILKNSMSMKYMRRMRKMVRENPPLIPVLLLWAKEDVVVPPAFGKKYQKLMNLPDERLIWMDKTSHFMQVDSPEETIAHILKFGQQ